MPEPPHFVFVTCQVSAAAAVKEELSRRRPEFRFAYSRPGFLTFKLPEHHGLRADFELESVFARAYGLSLGKVTGENLEELARNAWGLCAGRAFQQIHAWHRDVAEPGCAGSSLG